PSETAQIWNKLATLYWMLDKFDLKPVAQVLAEKRAGSAATPSGDSSIGGGDALARSGVSPNSPVICFQYFGGGRVLFHAIDSTWRWRAGAGDKFFARYWVQTIRFLARGKLGKGRGVQLTTDRREYRR